jgi:hypothetical protein
MLDEPKKLSFLRSQGLPLASVTAFAPMQFQPRVIAIVVPIALVLRSPIALAAMALVLAWSAALPALNPFDAFYNKWIRPRTGGDALGPARPPRRFAQALASLMLGATAGLLAAGFTLLALTIAALFLVAVALVVLRGFCFGSYVFRLLRRVHRLRRGRARTETPVTQRLEA